MCSEKCIFLTIVVDVFLIKSTNQKIYQIPVKLVFNVVLCAIYKIQVFSK